MLNVYVTLPLRYGNLVISIHLITKNRLIKSYKLKALLYVTLLTSLLPIQISLTLVYGPSIPSEWSDSKL